MEEKVKMQNKLKSFHYIALKLNTTPKPTTNYNCVSSLSHKTQGLCQLVEGF